MHLFRLPQIVCSIFASLCCAQLHGQTTPASTPSPAAVTLPAKENFQIYLLMGQSNMAGRAPIDPQAAGNPRVLALNAEGQWVVAHDPLHAQVGRIEPGGGPGIPFALAMLRANSNITIGLVPCAVGGTALKRWQKGADLYEKALGRAKTAAQSGVIKGVLWHQGETDTAKQGDAESYETRLVQMLTDLRQDLNLTDLPIVVGQIGGFLSPDKCPYADAVRAAIRDVPAKLAHVGYADSTGLTDKGDHLHFDARSQQELGARFASAMQSLQK